uniref:IPPc domain-containing protein n=2 Tax=Rhodnius prolixus TaxID=13249 RepID=T1HRP0_RHOPR
MILNVFLKSDSAWALEDAEVEREMTGLAGLYGNKGGVFMKFKLHGQKFCIVNSHFHAHDEGLSYRIQDYKEVNNGREEFCYVSSDYIFWLGDLNFRIQEKDEYSAQKIYRMIQDKQLAALYQQDQLKIAKDSGKIFRGYQEASIKFAPTFKLVVDSG